MTIVRNLLGRWSIAAVTMHHGYDRDFCLDVLGEHVRRRGGIWRLLSISPSAFTASRD